MPSTSYLDTSYLLKAYALESNSEAVTEYIRRPGPALLVSSLTDVELASALTRKLPVPDGQLAFEDYLGDRRAGLFVEVGLSPEVYRVGQVFALDLCPRFRIRSLDVLHLAIAKHHKATSFCTYDGPLAAAAHQLGLAVVGARP